MITHGLSVGLERIESEIFVSLKAVGKLTHEDYKVMIPMIEQALQGIEHPKIDILFDASDWHGWEFHAAWDDFKFGLKHGKEFNKIAVVGAENLSPWFGKLASWFISGEVRQFGTRMHALEWINS